MSGCIKHRQRRLSGDGIQTSDSVTKMHWPCSTLLLLGLSIAYIKSEEPGREDPDQPIQLQFLFGLDNQTYEEGDLKKSAETSHPTASTREKQVKNYPERDESDGPGEAEFEVPSHENVLAITSNITLLEQDQFIRDLMDQINSLYESAQWMYDEAERHFNLAEKLVEKADRVADRAEASRRHLSEWMQRYGLGWDVADMEDVVAENVVETNDLDDQL
ncbi:hypothetical protein CRM22_004841 [Opisthorchis felineus]|uniref:Uncharacterized protein n=1 Tax=Opisthorchis felineus TaxID=147828 RepID=A0A4S2M0J1_OPIFE|nr:hypothetical protein CRM22_004841 [Opisthorchis felineus]